MFQVPFWCVEVSTSIPCIKWSVCPCVLLFNVWRGRGFGLISMAWLRLHCCLLLSYLQFCVRLFPSCFRPLRKLDRTLVWVIVLVVVVTAPTWWVRFVRVVALVVLVFGGLCCCGYLCHFLGSFWCDCYGSSCWLLWISLALLPCRNPWYSVYLCYD